MKKMKKIFALCLSLILVLGVLPAGVANAESYSGSCGTNVKWELDTSTGVLNITGSGDMGDYGYSSLPWYSDKRYIKSVNVENGVTSIGSYAFYGCSSLTSITIPYSVTSIGDSAFYYCSSLTSITIPDSVTSIGDSAFYYCSSLTSITIPDSVKSIGEKAFSYCSSLTSITIPDSLKSIGKEAFSFCSRLTSITIPDSVKSIGKEAFSFCSRLTSITIPDSVTSIEYGAFQHCIRLTSITIPDSVTNIGDSAFFSCDSLTSITVDSNNKNYASIDGVLFNKDRTELIQYPEGILETSYVIPDGVTSIGYTAFNECSSLTSITIPDSVTSIGDSAFQSCDSLTSITIPASVTSIGDYAFVYCSSLTGITVDSNNKNYSSVDGVFFNKDRTELIQYPEGKSETSYVIPDSVTSIGSYAFEDCGSLTGITIPDSVKSIGKGAFSFCSRLTSITIPDSVTSIEYGAFQHCRSLTSITIPNSVTSISERAFNGCSSLKRVVINNPKCQIYNSGFTIESTATICGHEGSTAQAYAEMYGIEFEAIDCQHSYKNKVTCDATCVNEGIMTYTCTICGDSYTESIPALGHTDNDNDGVCDVCGVLLSESHEHSYVSQKTRDATCCFEGIMTYTCTICGDSYTETIPPLGHDFEEYEVQEPNCFENGWIIYQCRMCGTEFTEIIPNTGHNYGEWEETKKATCVETGTEERVCFICQEIETKITDIDPSNHVGETTTKNAEPATCYTTGYTGDIVCDSCKAVIQEGTVIDMIDHIDENNDGICDYCGFVIGDIDAVLGYKITSEVSYDRYWLYSTTLGEDWGNEDGIFYNPQTGMISVCERNYVFYQYNTITDEVVFSIVSAESMESKKYVIRAMILAYVNEPMPICEWEQCYIEEENCPNLCTDWYVGNLDIAITDNFTCEAKVSEDGKYIYIEAYRFDKDRNIVYDERILIEIDGELYKLFVEVGDCIFHAPLGHIDENNDGVCDRCNEAIADEHIHTPYTYTQPSTCKVSGYTITFCELCNEQLDFEVLPLADHTPYTFTQPSTCKVPGYTITLCEFCEEQLGFEVLPLADHTWSEWTVTREATILAEGEEERTCSVCGEKETQMIPIIPSETKENEETGISVTYSDDGFDGEIEVEVKEEFTGTQFLGTSFGKVETWNIKISLDGKEVQPNKPVYVRIPIPAGFNRNTIAVYHINTATGQSERMDITIDGAYICFYTSSFSPYVVVDESTKQAEPEPTNPTKNCTCSCHKSGITNFFWKIANFFHKLFGMKQYKTCACGKAHW